ncbi:MAG: glycosyltransferase family 9 protein [Lautropia sp.]
MRPLIVRLPNWVGDVVMALPALERLTAAGFAPRLVGRRWAAALLAGHPWPVTPLPAGLRERVAALRRLRAGVQDGGGHHPSGHHPSDRRGDRRVDTLLLTNSLSSALEARLAGLRPLGYRQDGRGWLLTRAIAPPPLPLHESQRFDRLAAALCDADLPGRAIESTSRADRPTPATIEPTPPRLRVSDAAASQAAVLLAAHGLATDRPYAAIVPFATGTLGGVGKAWPEFPAFAADLAARLPVIVVPGPAEAAQARRDYPSARTLEDVDLGVYAALLQRAAVVVANDTGPGHVAAAVGAPTVSVLGPTDAARYRALGPRATRIQAVPWPDRAAVAAAVAAILAATSARDGERPSR